MLTGNLCQRPGQSDHRPQRAGWLLVATLLAGCHEQTANGPDYAPTPPNPDPVIEEAPADAFFRELSVHCGHSYAGRITANQPPPDQDPFVDQRLIVHIRDCTETELRLPFHVGEDRSRTWILRRDGERLQLKHEHRHADGSEDAVSQYGGTSTDPGNATRQSFPIDSQSRERFEREGLIASLKNVWTMEIEPERRLVYELSRPSGRLFRVEFDLSRPVETPPAAWGSD